MQWTSKKGCEWADGNYFSYIFFLMGGSLGIFVTVRLVKSQFGYLIHKLIHKGMKDNHRLTGD